MRFIVCKVPAAPAGKQAGFTIVEVLVAAAVTAISIVGTVTLVRKAQELTTLDRHRRAARLIIDRYLEQTGYQQMSFANLESGMTTRAVTIDSVSNNRLRGVMTDSISARLSKTGANTTATPYKKVVLTVRWLEWGANDSSEVRVEKWISP